MTSEITAWNNGIDNKLAEADLAIEELRQMQFETKLLETRMKYETELASAKVETLNTIPQKSKGESEQNVRVKLPKLVISKFNGPGALQDWQRIWGQFKETIDKTTMPPITKFTYLCELLDPKIKHVVDSLPFTTEGYNRAKSILQDPFGKESEIIKSYVKDILDLPYIPCSNPRKIRDSSDRLNHCVQVVR